MHLVIPPVALTRLPETHDPALHRTPLDVLLPLCEYRPVLTHADHAWLEVLSALFDSEEQREGRGELRQQLDASSSAQAQRSDWPAGRRLGL